MIKFLLPCLLTIFFQPGETPNTGDKVLFLGDSNTFAGQFIVDLDTYLARADSGKKNITLINLGLPSETISGLSEKDHPYPRPDVHERVDRALKAIKPGHVVIGYGMNDGIYSPFDESRFKKYQEGYQDIIKKCSDAGAKITLLTPDPFEPMAVKAKLLPLGKPDYSYKNPYEKYDSVLEKYSGWLASLGTNQMAVADAHSAIHAFLKKRRQVEPGFIFSGDGIHPNASGHWLVAESILDSWKASPTPALVVEAKEMPIKINLTGKLPFAGDSNWDKGIQEDFQKKWGAQVLKINGLKEGNYKLSSNKSDLGVFTNKDLEKGLDLSQFKNLESNLLARELRKLCSERTKILGLAWLDEVGHKRPDTPKGKPLVQARKIYDDATTRIHEILATNIEINLSRQP